MTNQQVWGQHTATEIVIILSSAIVSRSIFLSNAIFKRSAKDLIIPQTGKL